MKLGILLWHLFLMSQKYTEFTRLQDDPQKNMSSKKYFSLNFIHLIHDTC